MNMMTTNDVVLYEAPHVDIVMVDVESGFSASGGTLERVSGVSEETEW